MSPPFARLLLLTAFGATAAFGCKPKIGDECQISTDCSAATDRLCDITAPSGYCTVYNCEPGTCPVDESLCVQFGSQRSSVTACQDKQSPSPYARGFCMATCEGQDDCRQGYECASLSAGNAWGALLIDGDRGGRACMVPQSSEGIPSDRSGNVCQAESPSSGGSGVGGSGVGGSGVGGSSGGAGVGGTAAGSTGDGGAAGDAAVGGQSSAGQSGAAG